MLSDRSARDIVEMKDLPLDFDHEQLPYRFQGRDSRPTEIHGKIVKEILA